MNRNEMLQTVKDFLVKLTGIKTKLEDQVLADGVTTIEADSFEAGQNVSVVGEEGSVPLPIGEYELADGKILVVTTEGVIAEIKDAPMGEENPQEAQNEVPVEAEKTPQQTQAKKIVKTEEVHFSAMEEKIKELEAKIVELSKVEEVVEEVKPIVHNPEKTNPVSVVKLGSQKNDPVSNILNKIYK